MHNDAPRCTVSPRDHISVVGSWRSVFLTLTLKTEHPSYPTTSSQDKVLDAAQIPANPNAFPGSRPVFNGQRPGNAWPLCPQPAPNTQWKWCAPPRLAGTGVGEAWQLPTKPALPARFVGLAGHGGVEPPGQPLQPLHATASTAPTKYRRRWLPKVADENCANVENDV